MNFTHSRKQSRVSANNWKEYCNHLNKGHKIDKNHPKKYFGNLPKVFDHSPLTLQPCQDKTCLWGFRPGLIGEVLAAEESRHEKLCSVIL